MALSLDHVQTRKPKGKMAKPVRKKSSKKSPQKLPWSSLSHHQFLEVSSSFMDLDSSEVHHQWWSEDLWQLLFSPLENLDLLENSLQDIQIHWPEVIKKPFKKIINLK